MATTQPQIQVGTDRARATPNLELLSNWQVKGVAGGVDRPARALIAGRTAPPSP